MISSFQLPIIHSQYISHLEIDCLKVINHHHHQQPHHPHYGPNSSILIKERGAAHSWASSRHLRLAAARDEQHLDHHHHQNNHTHHHDHPYHQSLPSFLFWQKRMRIENPYLAEANSPNNIWHQTSLLIHPKSTKLSLFCPPLQNQLAPPSKLQPHHNSASLKEERDHHKTKIEAAVPFP